MALKKPHAFWPLVIDSTKSAIRITDDFNAGAPTTANVASTAYTTPETLFNAVLTAINSVLGSPDATYSIDYATGRVTFSRTETFSLDFSIANSVGEYIGFEDEVRSAATSHAATEQMQNSWWSTVTVMSDHPFSRIRHGGASVALNDKTQYVHWSEGRRRTIELAWLDPWKTFIDKESAGKKYGAIERLFVDGYSKFRWWPEEVSTGATNLALDPKQTFEEFRPARQFQTTELYRLVLRTLKFVA